MVRFRIHITGIVQGVGFRPFIYNLARHFDLSGWVLNNAEGVRIEVEGPEEKVQAFLDAVRTNPPPLARIDGMKAESCPPAGEREFVIRESRSAGTRSAMVSPDIATCPDCQKEMLDPKDRRFGYPFINCTNCGPRYTIIKDVPYDRAYTTMADFKMCPACRGEYEDPANRRFHAQPNACADCGPGYRLIDREGREQEGDPIAKARELICSGAIMAVKGIGGYHLVCDARNIQAVRTLRARKIREDKPFAVMAGSIEEVCRHCVATEQEQELLTEKARPIVLLTKAEGYSLAPDIAPGNPNLGVMLPYAPVHWLLLKPDDMWVMTSGNTSDEPIAYDDGDAVMRLGTIADFFLVHNRIIHRRVDDSVVRVFGGQPYFLRRSRGYAPAPIGLAREIPPVLACGGELKNTFCLTRHNLAFMSAHIGDLENMATFESYRSAVREHQRLFDIRPELVAYDLHPEYLSTKFAMELDLPKVGVQHHHAHIASVLAEHGEYDPVIGVAFDGTGYGPDGTIWGGEFMIADCREYRRAGHVSYMPLPGGSKAIKEPWRLAAWMLHLLYGDGMKDLPLAAVRALPPGWELVVRAAEKGINSPLSCGAGRLFDTAAALLGIRDRINYEGQAAVEIELLAGNTLAPPLPFEIGGRVMPQLDFTPAFKAIADGLLAGVSRQELAAGFHAAVARAVIEMVCRLGRETGLKKAALSGGVFQNITLLAQIVPNLERQGFTVYLHRQTPANDGGLALGQAIIAGERSKAGCV